MSSTMGSATSFLDQAAKGKKHYVLKNNNFREPFPDNLKKIWFGAGCFGELKKVFGVCLVFLALLLGTVGEIRTFQLISKFVAA